MKTRKANPFKSEDRAIKNCVNGCGFYTHGGTDGRQEMIDHLSMDCTSKHTEDCMDANDDTSVFKGKCICPKPQHTPTPWNLEGNWIVKGFFGIHELPTSNEGSQAEHLANAAFIVTACNNFIEMAELLRASQGMTTDKGWKSWNAQVQKLNVKLAEGK